MYLGRVVEVAETDVIFETANHPCTQALLNEVPMPHIARFDSTNPHELGAV